MKFFYAKIGKGNSLAAAFLVGDTPIGRPAVPIFFDCTAPNRDALLSGGSGKEQAQCFFECADDPQESRIVILHDCKLVIAQPAGQVSFHRCDRQIGYADSGEYIKLLPVQILFERSIAEVPSVLATMTANAYYYTGTFRKISDVGVLHALRWVLSEEPEPLHAIQEVLLCLSSIELETLIARLLEEAGCFVPAYRGGALKGIDVIARNTSGRRIDALGVTIEPMKAIAVQVKRTRNFAPSAVSGDLLIVGERDVPLVLSLVAVCPRTRAWLDQSLSWLTEHDRRSCGLLG